MSWTTIRRTLMQYALAAGSLAAACSSAWAAEGAAGDEGPMFSWYVIRHALLQYLYGIGWLVIAVGFCIGTYKFFNWVDPMDFRKELERENMAVGIVVGMLLLGLTLGTLIFAGMLS